ncbi:hypothetical protein As57867_005728, partial [Aphanomyces stellatus]
PCHTQEASTAAVVVTANPTVVPGGISRVAIGNAIPSSDIEALLRKEEGNVFPFKASIFPLLFCLVVILAQSLLRGGHGTASVVGVKCGSAWYWVLILPAGLLLGGVTYLMGKKLVARARLYEQLGLDHVQGDVHWNPYIAQVVFPVQCFVAGVVAALLGIGGGVVQAPVMIEYGVTPLVQSSTTSYMILFTSTSTTIQYLIAGQFPGELQYDYVLWYTGLGFLGGLLGKNLVTTIIRKTGRMSYFLYFLAANMACYAIAMGYIGVKNVLYDLHLGLGMGFSGLC